MMRLSSYWSPVLPQARGGGMQLDLVWGLALERSRVVIQAPGRQGGVWEQVPQGRQTWLA